MDQKNQNPKFNKGKGTNKSKTPQKSLPQGVKQQPWDRPDENIETACKRIRSFLNQRDRACCNIVMVLEEQNTQKYADSKELTHNLIKRIWDKEKGKDPSQHSLLNPIHGAEPRPVTPKELKIISNAKLEFDEKDVLYISGHSNNTAMTNFTAPELVEKIADFLEKTGIGSVKLAGCHTGTWFDAHQINNMQIDRGAGFQNRYNPAQIDALSQVFAKDVSQALADKGISGIKVYGYVGELNEEHFKSQYPGGKDELHSAVKIYEGQVTAAAAPAVYTNGAPPAPLPQTTQNGHITDVKLVRASEARVCYVDGNKVEDVKDKTIKENFREDKIGDAHAPQEILTRKMNF